MRLPISPRITKPSDDTYHNRQSRVDSIRAKYEKKNSSNGRLSYDERRSLSSSASSVDRSNRIDISNNSTSRRFVPNVNSPTWKSLQDVMKSKISSISPRALSSPRLSHGGDSSRGFFDTNKPNKVSSSQQLGGGVDSYSLTAASTNSVDDMEMKFSSSLDDENKDDSRYCNKAVESRDEQEVDKASVDGRDSCISHMRGSVLEKEVSISEQKDTEEEEKAKSSKKQLQQRPPSTSLSLQSFVERQNNKAELPLTILQNTSSITSVSETNSPNGLKMTKSTSSNYLSSISSYSKSTYSSTKHQSGGSSISGSSSKRSTNNGKDTNDDLNACPSSDTSTSSLIYSMNDSFDVGSTSVSNVGKLLPSLSLDDDEMKDDKSLDNMTNVIDKLVRDADKQLTNLNHDKKNNEKTYLSSSEEGSSEDEEGRDIEAADLVANTLAECRLLLDMSPPPTPVGYQEEKLQLSKEEKKNVKRDTGVEKEKEVPPPMQSDKITVLHHYPKQQEEVTVKDPIIPVSSRRSSQEISDVSISKASSINNSIQPSLSSIAKFLTCPTCNQEFSEEYENAMPLHSFACDHIICRGCVFGNNAASQNGNESKEISTAVACPDCGEKNAFDTCRPVVSRAYLNLITKMKSVGSIKSSSVNNDDDMKEERRVRIDNNTGRVGDRRGGGTVPTQISVPSPRVDRQDIQERTEETRGVDMNEETSVVSNDFSKSSLTLSTTRRLHKPLPTLAIETGEQSAPSIPTLDVISSTPNAKATLAATDMTKEPITPVSRAEYRFLQRKEKLAQSLEKVNRILERSKANKQQVEDRVVHHSQEKVSIYQNMTLTQVQEDENRDAVDAVDTNEEAVRDMAPGYLELEVRQAPPSRLEQQKQLSITGRRNVELRVDTGPKSTTALQARRSKAEELDINAYPVQNDTVDIFRTSNYDDAAAPQLIEFGTHFIGQTFSNGSSLTDMDTLFLLGGGKKSPATCTSVQSNNKFSSPFKKDRLNNIMKSSPMKSRGHLNSIMKSSRSSQSLSNMDNDAHQQEQEPDVCPQFLPSLTYATMDGECNEVAGLIAMSPHNKDYNDPPQAMWGVGSRSVASADHCGSVLTSMTGSSKVKGKRSGRFLKQLTNRNDSMFPRPVVDDMQNNGNRDNRIGDNGVLQNENEQEAPTYDFVSHSCSMSPSSYCDDDNKQTSQLSGSGLVTHKPKTLHKKLLNTFRRGGKKKTMR